MERSVSVDLGGRQFSLQTGRVARQAGGSVWVQLGGTVVLVAATADKNPTQKRGFVPLTVDYRERTYAAGKIPGGFFKREGRPSETEVLSSRLIDRPIRSFLPKNFHYEMQILCTVLSSDQEHDPDVLALVGASAALQLSDIPMPEVLSGVRVGKVGGDFVVNPTHKQLEESTLDVVVAGTDEDVVMVEGGTKEVPEAELLEALRFALGYIRVLNSLQRDLAEGIAKAKRPLPEEPDLADLEAALAPYRDQLSMTLAITGKEARASALDALLGEAQAKLAERFPEREADVAQVFHDMERDLLRATILDHDRRADGRKPDQIRPIRAEVSVLPRTHGSALFTRGETQSLAVTTLGTAADEQRVEELEGQSWKSYMLHYNFPPFSVGEVRPMRGPGRREVGHGALAERAVAPVIPADSAFPYTIRVVSDILESNGSSSMASVCAASLSLMDAGVPIKAPVAGIAMGLVKEGARYAVLTDILGVEDHLGDMDFKVTGTAAGVTAFQMDSKIGGVDFRILAEALERARDARLYVLEVMQRCLASPRPEVSVYAPRISVIHIHPDKIREVIGPGGKVINRITEETGAQIDIEDSGEVRIAAYNRESGIKAEQMIRDIVEDPEVGRVYAGKVRSIVPFGAFIEIVPGRDGLLHISEIDHRRTEKVEDVFQLGDVVEVKVIAVDREGKIKLSRKVLLPEPERETSRAR
jgi:polyribonucleotide nucleotidyltransferase